MQFFRCQKNRPRGLPMRTNAAAESQKATTWEVCHVRDVGRAATQDGGWGRCRLPLSAEPRGQRIIGSRSLTLEPRDCRCRVPMRKRNKRPKGFPTPTPTVQLQARASGRRHRGFPFRRSGRLPATSRKADTLPLILVCAADCRCECRLRDPACRRFSFSSSLGPPAAAASQSQVRGKAAPASSPSRAAASSTASTSRRRRRRTATACSARTGTWRSHDKLLYKISVTSSAPLRQSAWGLPRIHFWWGWGRPASSRLAVISSPLPA